MKLELPTLSQPFKATLSLPGSKSFGNRALLLAALAEGESVLSKLPPSEDLLGMARALQALGVEIEWNEAEQSVRVKGGVKHWKRSAKIHCQESGTLARFLLVTCAVVGGDYSFDAAPSLRKRPFASLLRFLREQGVEIEASEETFPLRMRSKGLRGGEVDFDAWESSQVLSALVLVAPYLQNTLRLNIKNLVSASYLNLSFKMSGEFKEPRMSLRSIQATFDAADVNVAWMEQSDIRGLSDPHSLTLAPAQPYHARTYIIEPDLSNASYFFAAAAATSGELFIPNLVRHEITQGDVKFLSYLESMGCRVEQSTEGLRVFGTNTLHGVNLNLKDTPDLFPTMAALAPLANSPTQLTGLSHTRNKESDRLAVMSQALRDLGIKVEEGADTLVIYPREKIQGASLSSHQDHRIVMAMAVLALKTPGIVMEGVEAVNKSFPDFFKVWQGCIS